jgi:hypothetical protein
LSDQGIQLLYTKTKQVVTIIIRFLSSFLVSTKVVNLQLSFSVESGLELKLLFVRRSAFKDGEADSAQIDIDRRAITTKKRKRRTRRIKN